MSTLSVDLIAKIFKILRPCFLQDAFCDNFVIQWHPLAESLRTMEISFTRPRVYLMDFEVAVQFPAECSEAERVSMGFPLGGSFTEPEHYARRHAPEFATGIAYSPFKLDVWQLGISFSDFKVRQSFLIFALLFACLIPLIFQSTIPAIDDVLVGMTNIDPGNRLDAREALDRLGKVICSMTPESLLIKPLIIKT